MYHFGCLYDTLLRVPLILRSPDLLPANRAVDAQVQLVDVMPSIAHAARVAFSRQGRSYADRPDLMRPDELHGRDPPAYAEFYPGNKVKHWQGRAPRFDFAPLDRIMRAVRTPLHKYICASDGSAELYDLRRDSGEREDLLTSSAGSGVRLVAHSLRRQLDQELPEPDWGPLSASEEYEAEAAEQLRGLGYL
jgi:arylsulfatase A-like enzyme